MDAHLAAIAKYLPPSDMADPAAARARIADMVAASEGTIDRSWTERVDVEVSTVPRPDGSAVPIRIYTPRQGPGPRGGLVHFHPGAFIVGDLDVSEWSASRYAEHSGLVVVDVDYRLAPEHPFPAGFDDGYLALEWTAEHAAELGIDPARLAVGGASAGGALAAAVALAARDRGGPALAFQLLLYPVLDDRLTTASMRQMTDTPMFDAPSAVHMWRHYLGDRAGSDDVPTYAAPARAADKPDGLADLPPAYVLACDLDPLRDEDVEYAAALMRAGVSVELHVVAGAYHGFEGFPTDISRRTSDEIVGALARALGSPT